MCVGYRDDIAVVVVSIEDLEQQIFQAKPTSTENDSLTQFDAQTSNVVH